MAKIMTVLFLKGGMEMIDKQKFQAVVNSLLEGEPVEKFLGFNCNGFILNRDKRYVEGIINGIKRCSLHCPCRVQKTEENICCCTDFIENQNCCCRLWIKEN